MDGKKSPYRCKTLHDIDCVVVVVGCPVVDAEEGGESPPVGQVGIPTPADVPPECSGDDNHEHGDSAVVVTHFPTMWLVYPSRLSSSCSRLYSSLSPARLA